MHNYTKQYSPESYSHINQYLSTGEGSGNVKAASEHITAALDHEIGVDCITCRGGSHLHGTGNDDALNKIVAQVEKGNFSKAAKLKSGLVGHTVTNDTVMSTSPNNPLEGFRQLPVQYVFKTPKNAKAVDITGMSSFGGGMSYAEQALANTGLFGSVQKETEVAFKPGTKYTIDAVDFSVTIDKKGKKKGQVFVTATILTDEDNTDSRTDADEPEWITVNGTHIPVKDGELQGSVGEKIERYHGSEKNWKRARPTGIKINGKSIKTTVPQYLSSDEYTKALQSATNGYGENEDRLSIPYKKIENEESIEDAVKAINPHFGEEIEYMENCVRCALALELRRRGFDVESTPHLDKFSDWDMMEGEGFLMSFVGIGKNTVCIESKPTQKNIDSAIEKMVENGDGSRYLISVRRKYNRAGHAFNCEVVKGRAVFVDPQSGEVGDGALSVLRDNSCKDFTIRRVDNLETVNEVICMAANERGLNDD